MSKKKYAQFETSKEKSKLIDNPTISFTFKTWDDKNDCEILLYKNLVFQEDCDEDSDLYGEICEYLLEDLIVYLSEEELSDEVIINTLLLATLSKINDKLASLVA